ncbi:MAG: leucyl/phenylalanyl-tRNA--protein transferase [Arenimonas sp.]
MTRLPIALLSPDPAAPFPPVQQALREPDGLLATGGDLTPVRLLNAYRNGIFPWSAEGQPILWWSPDPRVVFETESFQLASRFRRRLRNSDWILRSDTAFDQVIRSCASLPRPGQDGTWITSAMIAAYRELHRLGHAHSIEVFSGAKLVGGIYGVAIGRMFFGESMFSAQTGGSKVALAGLCRLLSGWGWPLIDAQVENPHLLSLGARQIPRARFMRSVSELVQLPGRDGSWSQHVPDWSASALAEPLA